MGENTTTDPSDPEDRRVLTVRVAMPDDVLDELEERLAALDEGKRPEPTHEVDLQRKADVNRLLSPKNLKLLRTIARERPGSIREPARLVDRDVRQVHDNLADLDRLNLIRIETEGRARRRPCGTTTSTPSSR